MSDLRARGRLRTVIGMPRGGGQPSLDPLLALVTGVILTSNAFLIVQAFARLVA